MVWHSEFGPLETSMHSRSLDKRLGLEITVSALELMEARDMDKAQKGIE